MKSVFRTPRKYTEMASRRYGLIGAVSISNFQQRLCRTRHTRVPEARECADVFALRNYRETFLYTPCVDMLLYGELLHHYFV